MPYSGSNYYRLPTPYGDLIVWSFGRDSETGLTDVGFRTERKFNRSPYRDVPVGGWDGVVEHVTIYRVEYNAHDRVAVNDSGEIVSWSDSSPLMRPLGSPGNITWPNQSSPAVTKWRETIAPAVETFLATEAGQTMLAQGHREAHARDVSDARERIATARAELIAAWDALVALEASAELERDHA